RVSTLLNCSTRYFCAWIFRRASQKVSLDSIKSPSQIPPLRFPLGFPLRERGDHHLLTGGIDAELADHHSQPYTRLPHRGDDRYQLLPKFRIDLAFHELISLFIHGASPRLPEIPSATRPAAAGTAPGAPSRPAAA